MTPREFSTRDTGGSDGFDASESARKRLETVTLRCSNPHCGTTIKTETAPEDACPKRCGGTMQVVREVRVRD